MADGSPSKSGEVIDLDYDDLSFQENQTDEVPLEVTTTANTSAGPGSRYITPTNYCVSKTLLPFDVIHHDGKLQLTIEDAITLFSDPQIMDYPACAYNKCLLAFDTYDVRYGFILHNYLRGGQNHFGLAGDWSKFARSHKLKAGDKILFYQIRDAAVHVECYYIVRYFRRPADRKPARVSTGDEITIVR